MRGVLDSGAIRYGIDLGGTKIELIALDASGAVRHLRRVDTPQGRYRETLDAIIQLVRSADASLASQGSIGIGTPGAVSRKTGRIKNSNSVCLNGQPLREDLEALLERPVRMANDADCFALSEASDGAAAGLSTVFGVILGTGVGGGLVVGGHLLQGPNAIAGEWGHNPIPWPGPEEWPGASCYCGKTGCIETVLSGSGLSRDYEAMTQNWLEAPAIVEKAQAGERAADLSLSRYENRLARGLAHVINLVDPDAIVLGGGLSNIQRLYQNVPKRWGQYVFSDQVDTQLLPPLHGDSSGVRGAAWLWR